MALNIVIVQHLDLIQSEALKRAKALKEILPQIGLTVEDFFSAGIGTIKAAGEGLAKEGFVDSGEINGFYRAILFTQNRYDYPQFFKFARTAIADAMRNPITRREITYHEHETAVPGDDLAPLARFMKQPTGEVFELFSDLDDPPEQHLVLSETAGLLNKLAQETRDPLSRKLLSDLFGRIESALKEEDNRFVAPEAIMRKAKSDVVDSLIKKLEIPESELEKKRLAIKSQLNNALKELVTAASNIEDFDVWVRGVQTAARR